MENQQFATKEERRLQESADFWRARSTAFEIALREIVAAHDHDRSELACTRWEIAINALEAARK